ncbi:IQ motif and ankyrin repeat domain-containing protein 1-like isoform X2 [Ostrea edulis]|uniref:IQ motif and ankyrin repeat domain-containing protein 1-like isoform X2 n=1 Tax=Ostrea edulis TaxID=37623 RepID=UPI0024AF4CC2|nr:IQ motif and ankyrin repeat domain-containing protein 1-like isoform X2 [Ostrea edulis]
MPPKKPVAAKPTKAPAKPAPKAAAGRGTTPAARKGAPAPGGAKKGAAPPAAGKGKPADPPKPKAKVWTEKDDAALRIQTKYRQYRAKKMLEKKKKDKEEYEELMDRLEKEAFLQLVKMEQEKAEKERQKEEEERRRKREETKRKKRMLEAAFEGDVEEIENILKEVKTLDDQKGVATDAVGTAIRNKHLMNVIECEDANNNTPLSEAANGGDPKTLQLLLDKGADPNTQGQFKRTPLYRAAFAGHLEAVQVLLQNGADPRIFAEDGQNPEQVSSVDAVKEVLAEWDVTNTENLLQKLEAEKEKRKEEQKMRREAETTKLEGSVQAAQEEYDRIEKLLSHAYCELNKRITEHDTAVGSGFDRPELTLQAIHDEEDEVELLKSKFDKAREGLAIAKLKLREQMNEGLEASEDLPGLQIMIKELDDVLLKDVGNKIKDSGKWPLIIDRSAQAATFLRYRDTNYLNSLNPKEMEANKIRLSLLGAIRFGKPLVLDMMEVDMFHTVSDRFDEIDKGLMDKIMDKSIMQEENYLKLLKAGDGPEYEKNKFSLFRTQNFKFWIITKNPYPPDYLLDTCYTIRIYVPT